MPEFCEVNQFKNLWFFKDRVIANFSRSLGHNCKNCASDREYSRIQASIREYTRVPILSDRRVTTTRTFFNKNERNFSLTSESSHLNLKSARRVRIRAQNAKYENRGLIWAKCCSGWSARSTRILCTTITETTIYESNVKITLHFRKKEWQLHYTVTTRSCQARQLLSAKFILRNRIWFHWKFPPSLSYIYHNIYYISHYYHIVNLSYCY